MPASERNPSQPVTEAATLSERAATLVEHDILAGLLAPGSRLGIVDLVQRYEIGATPLREGLSRLMSRDPLTQLLTTFASTPFTVSERHKSRVSTSRSQSKVRLRNTLHTSARAAQMLVAPVPPLAWVTRIIFASRTLPSRRNSA